MFFFKFFLPFVLYYVFSFYLCRNYVLFKTAISSFGENPQIIHLMAGIYVHIPFCKSRCIYCGFYSTTALEMQEQYIDALIKELNHRRDYLEDEAVNTIYIGGGTPSLLNNECLKKLCVTLTDYAESANARLSKPAGCAMEEFTIECNPDDINEEYASLIASLGINRVSMGAQTFNDRRLSFLRRRHRSAAVAESVRILRRHGIENISIDLIFGFPDETIEEWKNDLECAYNLGVEHISAYSLTYEKGTALHHMLEKGNVTEIKEEIYLSMYDTLIDRLTSRGYEHYEISNFALPGYRSKHNSNYWRRIPYLGLGAAAHSFNLNSRQWNVSDIHEYIRKVKSCDWSIVEEKETLSDKEKYNDIITTSLRTVDGIDIRTLTPFFQKYLLESAKTHIGNGNLSLQSDILRLTRKGLYISDTIMVDLMFIE